MSRPVIFLVDADPLALETLRGDLDRRFGNDFVLRAEPMPSAALAAPLPLETSVPGGFAAGDVRYGSIKRVASAVGDGATAIRLVYEYLEDAPLLEVQEGR